ncbi:MAG: hypothetical protein V5A39_06190 [Haloarculaceae archaeon]
MTARHDRVEDLLYDGETVRETVDLEAGQVVVTSHRVLAFTPGTNGANFRQADLPNVEGVGFGAETEANLLERAIRFGVVGVVLAGFGVVVDFGSIVGDVDLTGGEAAGKIGIGGMLGSIQTLLGLIRSLDQYMQLFGAVALLLAALFLGVYWYLREPTLVVEVAGEDDIHVPRTDRDVDVVSRLERATVAGRTDDQAPGSDAVGDPPGEP